MKKKCFRLGMNQDEKNVDKNESFFAKIALFVIQIHATDATLANKRKFLVRHRFGEGFLVPCSSASLRPHIFRVSFL